MSKVIVRCAPPGVGGGSNLGMNTVDLAIHNIVAERGLIDEVSLCRPWPPYIKDGDGKYPPSYEFDSWPMEFDYGFRELGTSEPRELNFFWGDFQHGHNYIEMSARRAREVSERNGSKDAAITQLKDACYEHFMLERTISRYPKTKVAMYGGTLFQNRIRDYLDRRYVQALNNLYANAVFARVRDAYSAMKVGQLRNDYATNFMGADAALLSRSEELLSLERSSYCALGRFAGSVAVFFGRSARWFPVRHVADFVRRLSASLDIPISWIPWNMHGRHQFLTNHRQLDWYLGEYMQVSAETQLTPGDILRMIESASVVVTDTYHVAINAAVLNTPCVCIYDPSPSVARDANMGFHAAWRDKRVLHFLTFDLNDWLVPTTDLLSHKWIATRAHNICTLLRDDAATELGYRSLHRFATQCRKRIGDFLESYCDDESKGVRV